MSKPTDPVVIRVWNGDPDDVFALFPTDPADIYGAGVSEEVVARIQGK